MVSKFFDKMPAESGVNTHANKFAFNNWRPLDLATQKLPEELNKPIIRKVKRRTVYSRFKCNIWGADLADMQLISKFNKGFRFLLCAIDILSKYALVVPLKDKKDITITNTFQKILKESNRKLNKIWVDKGSEFYSRSVKKWLNDNDIEMYLIHNEGKSVVLERFIRTLKTKIYKCTMPKIVYIDQLDDMLNECSNTCHRTIKMKPVDVKDNTFIDWVELRSIEFRSNDKDKNIFAKGYTPKNICY